MIRRIGWISVAIGLVAVALWVVAAAVSGAGDFDRWVGWANIFALPVGAVGTGLVIADRVRRRTGDPSGGAAADRPPAPPDPTPHGQVIQMISASDGGLAQGALGPHSSIVNHAPPHQESPPPPGRPESGRRRKNGR